MAPEIIAASSMASASGLRSPVPGGVARVTRYSNSTDVYSLAVVIACVLTLKRPWPQLREWDIRKRVMNGELAFPSLDVPGGNGSRVVATIMALVRVAWSLDPTIRPTAEDLVVALEREEFAS